MSRSTATPVVLVTGVCADAMAAATIGLAVDLPRAVVLTHRIDVEAQQLHRVVSDVTGVLEREVVDLAHACVSCAIREDIVPTLHRLAAAGRWAAVVAHLPVAAEAQQVCRVLSLQPTAALRVTAVVAALDGPSLVPTLVGDALLAEEGRHTGEGDRRGTGEVACALVEYADLVSVHGPASDEGLALVRALTHPGAVIGQDHHGGDPDDLVAGIHLHVASEAWVDETRGGRLADLDPGVWRLDLGSDRPLHPDRLRAELAAIGGGSHRSRGCFWLPSRPGQALGWDGAGGQVSIGGIGPWGRREARTRIVVVGPDSLTSAAGRDAIRAAFARALLSDTELRDRGAYWEVGEDGFEPWLGAIRTVA